MIGTEPRLPPLPRDEWTNEAREVFAYWEGDEARQNGSRSNTMMTLANHPKLALASLDLGKYFMLDSSLTARQQKMIVMRVAVVTDSPYQWAHNSLSARQIGMSSEEVEGVREGHGSSVWGGEDSLLLEVIDAVIGGAKLNDDLWTKLKETWDRQQIMDVIHATGYFTTVAWTLIALRVQLEANFEANSSNHGKKG